MLCSRSSTFRSAVTFLLLFVVKSTKAEKSTSFNQTSLSSPHPAFESSPLSPVDGEEPSAVRVRRSASALPTTGADVDRIQSVEVEPTQFTITTTKQGPVESLKIHIELIDLQDNRTLPPIDLYGLFLVVARGRYTVPFLKPERWYGLSFTSENKVNMETNLHRESRLVKTASRELVKTSPDQLYEVLMHRNMDGEESAEQLYVTSRWTEEERIPAGELHVSVDVHCESSLTTEHMLLHADEDSVTIEISVDLLYDIENLNDSAHQVRARITPLKCHQVCWLSALAVQSATQEFRDESPLVCRDIESTTTVTYLRHLRNYTVQKNTAGYELVVETELNDDSEEGFITLSALNLSKNGSKVKSKTFSAASSNGTFHLPLSPDAVYAARYQYTKVKPFHYTTEEHFLIETAPLNSSKLSRPLIDVSFHVVNGSRKGDTEAMMTPLVTVSRGELYRSREVRLHMGPFCDNRESSTHVLAGSQSGYTVNLRQAVCSHSPKSSSYCDAAGNYTKCGPVLCYSTSVVLDGADYPSDVRCVNVTQHFPPVPSSSRSSYTSAILLILISLFI